MEADKLGTKGKQLDITSDAYLNRQRSGEDEETYMGHYPGTTASSLGAQGLGEATRKAGEVGKQAQRTAGAARCLCRDKSCGSTSLKLGPNQKIYDSLQAQKLTDELRIASKNLELAESAMKGVYHQHDK